MTWRLPSRIETERLVIRRLEPGDVPAMHLAILENVDHLLPFIPWAPFEPQTLEQREAKVSEFAAAFDAGEDFSYGMFDRATGAYLGGTGLHTRVGPDALEIGYWIRADRQGEGWVSEAVLALTPVALLFARATRVEVWCDPANARSNAVAARCGFARRGREVRGEAEFVVWTAALEALTREPAASAPLPHLFDSDGEELDWPVWPVPAVIETERLVIRRVTPADKDAIARVEGADPDRVAGSLARGEADGDFAMGLFDRATGEYLGSAGLHPLDDRPGLEIGYWIAASHEGRGLVTEAVLALTQVGLRYSNAETVEIFHRPENVRSGGVARRAGLTHRGRTRDTDEGVEMDRWVADASALEREPLASTPLPRLTDAEGTELAWPE